jgi:hypothetical protein
MRGFLGLVGFLEMVAGIGFFSTAPTFVQEIGGLIAFGFGVLTMAVVWGVQTIQELWTEREQAEGAEQARLARAARGEPEPEPERSRWEFFRRR